MRWRHVTSSFTADDVCPRPFHLPAHSHVPSCARPHVRISRHYPIVPHHTPMSRHPRPHLQLILAFHPCVCCHSASSHHTHLPLSHLIITIASPPPHQHYRINTIASPPPQHHHSITPTPSPPGFFDILHIRITRGGAVVYPGSAPYDSDDEGDGDGDDGYGDAACVEYSLNKTPAPVYAYVPVKVEDGGG